MAASLTISLNVDTAAFADGLKRALDQGKAFQEAIQENLSNIKVNLGNVENPLKDFPDKVKGSAIQSLIGFQLIQQAVQTLANTVQSLSAPFVELDTSMRNIGALGVKNFKEFESTIVDLSKTIPDSAAVIGDAIAEAVGSGVIAVDKAGRANIEQGKNFIEQASKLAIAGGTDIQTAVKGLSSTLNAYRLEASEAGRVSDVIFNTFNYGVSSVAELSKYLYEITPTAASLGISLEQVGGALATMTKQGIRTTVATDRLRAFLVALQKPNKELAAVMEQAGVSLAKLKDGSLTMQEAAQRIGKTTKELGLDINQVFAGVEAASTVLFLGGKNAKQAMEDLENVSRRNTVKEGFDVQTQGVEARIKVALNNINAQFIKFFGFVGDGATVAFNSIARLAPTIGALASVSTLIPEGAFANAKAGFASLGTTIVSTGGKLKTAFVGATAAAGSSLQSFSTTLRNIPSQAASAAGGFATSFAAALKNLPSQIATVTGTAFQAVVSGLRNLPAQTASFFTSLGSSLVGYTQSFLASSRSLVTGALSGIQSAGGAIVRGMASFLTAPLASLRAGFTLVTAQATTMWAAITGPVALVIAGIAAVAVIAVSLYDNFDDIKKAVNDFFNGAIDAFNQMKPVWVEFLSIIRQVGSFLFEFLKTPFEIITTIVRAFTGEAEQASGQTKQLGQSAQGAGQQTSFFKQALQTVLSTLINIKGTIGGVTAAFTTIKEVIGDAFRALASFNIKGVIDAFSGAGGKISASYDKGWNEATAIQKKSLDEQKKATEGKTQEEEEIVRKSVDAQVAEFKKLAFTLSPEQLKGRKELLEIGLKNELDAGKLSQKQYYAALKEITKIETLALKKFKDAPTGGGGPKGESEEIKVKKEQAELEKLRQQQELAGLSESQRKLKEFEIKAASERAALQVKIAKAEEKKQSELLKVLHEQEKELLKTQAVQRGVILNEVAEKEYAEQEKIEDAKLKQQIEALKLREEVLRGADEASIKERGAIRLKLLQLQSGKDIDKILDINAEYKKAAIEFQKVKLSGDPNAIAAAQAQFDAVKKKIMETAEVQQRLDIEKAKRRSAEIAIELDTEEALAQAKTDITEREFALRLVAAKRTYAKEIEYAGNNADLRLQAEQKFQASKYQIEQEYARRTNVLYDAALTLAELLPKKIGEAFSRNATANTERTKAAREELENIKKQEAEIAGKMTALEADMKKQRGSTKKASAKQYDDYNKEREDLLKKQAELEKELGKSNDTIGDALKKGLEGSFAGLAEALQARVQRAMKAITDTTAKVGGNLSTLFDGATASGKENFDNLKTFAIESVAVVGAKLGELAAKGELTAESFAKTIGAVAIDSVQQLILAYTPAIFTTAIGLLGPVAGPIAAVAAIATVMGLLGAAKSAIGFREGVHNFQGEGAIRIPGETTDPYLARLHPGEDVFSPEVSAQNRDLFKNLHDGVSARKYFEQNYLNDYKPKIHAELMASVQMQLRSTAEEALHERISHTSGMALASVQASLTRTALAAQGAGLLNENFQSYAAAPLTPVVTEYRAVSMLMAEQLRRQQMQHEELVEEIRNLRGDFEHSQHVFVEGEARMNGEDIVIALERKATKHQRQERARR